MKYDDLQNLTLSIHNVPNLIIKSYLAVMCVLGNKCDLKDQRQVSSDEGVQYAASIGALFFETSALTNEGKRNTIIMYLRWITPSSA